MKDFDCLNLLARLNNSPVIVFFPPVIPYIYTIISWSEQLAYNLESALAFNMKDYHIIYICLSTVLNSTVFILLKKMLLKCENLTILVLQPYT